MELVLIRHGEPDYSPCEERGFLGQGYDLAPLTSKGRQQAQAAAHHPALEGAALVLSSPYTRALQTAAEIVRLTGLPLQVELDLHELLPDRAFALFNRLEAARRHTDFLACHGEWPCGETRPWESISQLANRVVPVLEKYLSFGKVVVVTHGGVIRRFVPEGRIEYGQPYLVRVESPIHCSGWVE